MTAPTNVNEVQRLTRRIAALSRFISKAAEKSLSFFKGDILYLYLSVNPRAIGFVLVREEEGKQMSIYHVSKVFNGAENRYTLIKKLAFALVVSARRLLPYFLPHHVGVKITLPLKQTLVKLDTLERLVKCGAGIVVTSPQGEDLEFTIKFDFKASNNEAEYDALLMGMKMAHEAGARDLASYSDSQLIVKQVEDTYEAK
ncbi:hypothetical protein Sango_1142300 [Sesamum angolense]|uniref:RNase H type-1 domain-containing protein n=1 Tax=Sesamum angolense TaxID=2727404 RepID=A0AAE1WWC4_9LAMI|nr:hypothetical protein Sango_1142300 [Sesamum angolense]